MSCTAFERGDVMAKSSKKSDAFVAQFDKLFPSLPPVRERIEKLRKFVNSSAFSATSMAAHGAAAVTAVATAGRTARRYMAAAGKAKLKGANDTLHSVFQTLKEAGKSGITQASIQETLGLPHSTVWYALVKLRKRHAVAIAA